MDPIGAVTSGILVLCTAFMRFLSKYLIQVLSTSPLAQLPPILLGPQLEGNFVGLAEYISMVIAIIMVMVASLWHKKIGLALKSIGATILLVTIGGGVFYTILDELQATGFAATKKLIAENNFGILGSISTGGITDTVAALAATGMASWYAAYIVVFMYLLTLLLVACRLLFWPILILAMVSEKAKWWLDWMLTVMLFGTTFGPLILIGEILLGIMLNTALGPTAPFLAIVALVAGLALARHTLTSMMKGTKRSIAKVTNNIKVRGRVKTDDRPTSVNSQTATQQAIASQQPIDRGRSSLPRKIGNAVFSEAALTLAVKLGTMANPGTIATRVSVSALNAVHHHFKQKSGVPSGNSNGNPSSSPQAATAWSFLSNHIRTSNPNQSAANQSMSQPASYAAADSGYWQPPAPQSKQRPASSYVPQSRADSVAKPPVGTANSTGRQAPVQRPPEQPPESGRSN